MPLSILMQIQVLCKIWKKHRLQVFEHMSCNQLCSHLQYDSVVFPANLCLEREKLRLCLSLCYLQTYASACPVSPAPSPTNFPALSQSIMLQSLLSMLNLPHAHKLFPMWSKDLSRKVKSSCASVPHHPFLFIYWAKLLFECFNSLTDWGTTCFSTLLFIIEEPFVMPRLNQVLISPLEGVSPLRW